MRPRSAGPTCTGLSGRAVSTLAARAATPPSTRSSRTRSLARPFTYLADGVGKGSVVAVRLGGARTARGRGGARGRGAARVSSRRRSARRSERFPPPLVDLALWIADYYGSTPARALELVAPGASAPARRAPLTGSAGGARLARTPPAALTATQEAALDADRGARSTRRGARAPARRDRERQDRGVPPRLRRGARARARRDRARAGDRAHPADRRPLPRSLRRHASPASTRRSPTPSAATSASGSRAARRRVVVGARSAVFAPLARARR